METKPSSAVKKPATDWEAVERDYRAGVKTIRQIAETYGVSHTAVRKRAERDSWPRDLSKKIAAEAEALVRREAIPKERYSPGARGEQEVVEANALAIARVRIGQRTDIKRARDVANALLQELGGQVGPETVDLLEQLGELMRKPDDKGVDKLNDLYLKIISLPGRAKTMKDLGDTLKTLITLEREAFGIDNEPPKDEGLSALATAELIRLRKELSDA